MSNATEAAGTTDITARTLRDWPLPQPSFDGDKEVRGHVLIVGGAREMPGAVMLAATAALRAGAGKLTIATAASVAPLVAMAIPEARVIGLAETANGGFTLEAARKLGELAGKIGAMLVGPGMQDEGATAELVHALLPRFAGTALILDAAAMGAVRMAGEPHLLEEPKDMAHFRFAEPVLLTPHAGELSHLTGEDKEALAADPLAAATEAARRWNAVVALKGATTVIAAPDGQRWRHEGGNIGLAISGSGDALAGIIAGLAARGATLAQAAAWGVALHASAGEQLSIKYGVLGYLAREISAEVPGLLRTLAPG
ncbi:NAD(P)H-hydrate dehydratase [Pseudoduganella plicata]|uniref:ADP-dependent (S)-NAD(P)H-hydrate dehydratase n=1 Tax=Pseudoduganella plicata TaxID=321984 RepID=A0A4P7BKB2_9BURK|nr:NAD(P)H-hydrate dehydratase [Pseudoduganella plicata]QBQ38890.1 NAD(P)H-hydrate dehydratase [Pseudoduganella plicata]GGZ09464.1 ADP-dependent (S)-NAD(P)H-hydrate dehydratase [Pseudoduganella plicata]